MLDVSRLRFAAISAIGLVFVAAGCGEYDPTDPAAGVAVHVDPPHWPSDLPDAVDRLERGQDAARSALTAGRSEEARDDLVPVVRDLARWLPQVAADSDMPEPEWNQINRLSEQLLPIYEATLRDLDRGRGVDLDRLREANPLLDELREAIEKADPSWFAPLPVSMRGPADDQERQDDGEPITPEISPGESPEEDSPVP